jgi:FKBP-type peptidyl-prolyl cis-trans isomerase
MRSVPWCLLTVILSACRAQPAARPADAAPPRMDLTAPADVEHSPSGLRSKVMKPGTGTEHPEPQDLVEVHYTGWKADGTMFDSSVDRNAPAQFTVDGAIKGWSEGVQKMVVGERRRLWVPPDLAYGEHPPDRAPAGPLVFDIELLKILKRPRPLPAPPDLASPPAQKTRSGLAYRVLRKGTGKQHPGPASVVEVQYTGWAPDGRMLDSSVVGGQPSRMQLRTAGKGWTEAVQMMVVGEKARFWIPPALAAQMGASVPNMVYDVELIAIH